MKRTFLCAAALLLTLLLSVNSYAQYGGDNRNKIVMTITSGGKSFSADLNAVSTSVSRNNYEGLADTPKDTASGKKMAAAPAGEAGKTTFYLSMDVKGLEPAMLQVLAKRNGTFDGTITVTDSYGKNPSKKITFKGGTMYSYSDNYSGASYYDGAYGNVNLSIMCTGLAVDGVTIE